MNHAAKVGVMSSPEVSTDRCGTNPEPDDVDYERPTVEELFLFRIGSPEISDQRRSELVSFVERYPHNNDAVQERLKAKEREWDKFLKDFP